MCFTLGKFCFCVNLRTGVIAIACIWLVADCLMLAWGCYDTYILTYRAQLLMSRDYKYMDMESMSLLGVYWVLVLFDIIYSVAIPLHIMLVVGATKGRHKLLHGWVVAYAVLFIIFVVARLFTIAVGFYYHLYSGLITTAIFLVNGGLMLYFWIVVRSYSLQLRQQQQQQQNVESAARTTAGKVYRMVPMGDVPPAHGNYCDEGGVAMQPTAPPRYTISP